MRLSVIICCSLALFSQASHLPPGFRDVTEHRGRTHRSVLEAMGLKLSSTHRQSLPRVLQNVTRHEQQVPLSDSQPKIPSLERGSDNTHQEFTPLVTNAIYSAAFSGGFGNVGGVNTCYQTATPSGTDGSVPTDTTDKSISMWINLQGWASQWQILYDTTNTRNTPTYGHRLFLSQDTPGNPSSCGTLYATDWAGNAISIDGICIGGWYFVSLCIHRNADGHSSGTVLFVTYAGDPYFSYATSSSFTYLNIQSNSPYPVVLLGAKGYVGNCDDCFQGWMDNFIQWSTDISNPSWNRVRAVAEGAVTYSDPNLLGLYPMQGWGTGLGTSVVALAGSNPVTGSLNGGTSYFASNHNVCDCYGRVGSNDPQSLCLGQTTACQPYCTSKYWGVDCQSCNRGYYLVSGQTDCTACTAGTYSTAQGATSIAVCSTCASSTYSLAGWSACTGCTGGQYFDSVTACTSCPPGQYTPGPGYNTCFGCSAGWYSPGGLSYCSPCNPGTYGPSSYMNTCLNCAAGTYAPYTELTACFNCGVGTYSGTGASVCTNCAAGRYNANVDQSACTACPAGTYNSNTGSTSSAACLNCPANTYSTGGAASCPACALGTWSLAGSSTCQSCCLTCTNSACQSCSGDLHLNYCTGYCTVGQPC